MPPVNFWLSVGGFAALLSVVLPGLRWVLRSVIREELSVVKEDIVTLKVAVFNHLSHNEPVPDENTIRAALGFSPTTQHWKALLP